MKTYKVTTTLWCQLRQTDEIEAESAERAETKHEDWLRDQVGDCDVTDVDSHAVGLIDLSDPELV